MDLALPVPVVDDHDTGGFFAAAQRGSLAVLICGSCRSAVHLPLPRCPACRSTDVGWTDVSGTGHVYSWTRVTHPVHPAFEVPYTVLLVELDDQPGVRLVGQVPGTPPVHIGQGVHATFEDVRDGVVVPQWTFTDPIPSQRGDL